MDQEEKMGQEEWETWTEENGIMVQQNYLEWKEKKKREEREAEERREKRVVKCQAVVRSFLKRRRFVKMREAAIIIQARLRGFLDRREYLDKIAKIIKIQRWWLRLYDKEIVLRVTTIQALVRGFLARRRAAKVKMAKKAEEEKNRRREEEESLEKKRMKEVKEEEEMRAKEFKVQCKREAEEAERAKAVRKAGEEKTAQDNKEEKNQKKEEEGDKELGRVKEQMRAGGFGERELVASPQLNDEPDK